MTERTTYSNGETPSICIVGAGFSGLCAGIQLKKQLGLTTFTIFESNKDIGGTWFSNTYPGCACDVPSHLYSYSFERNPDWSKNYSPQPEIWRYMKKVTEKYDLYSHIKLETEVKTMTWNESIKKWKVETLDKRTNSKQTQLFDVVINGPGALRVANFPEQFKSFKGPIIHSAEWDNSIKLDNKVVGIVGSGASAIQIIPNIAPNVKELHCYQRKPGWVLPRVQRKFPGFVQSVFRIFPFLTFLLRAFLFLVNEMFIHAFKYGSRFNRLGKRLGHYHIKKSLPENPDLQAKVTPNFAFGCKRLLPSGEYYPALTLPNVTLHTENIAEVTKRGIISGDGNLQNLDVLILATGYRVHDYFAPMEIFGRDSENILEIWKTKVPRHYFGIVSNSAPNHFVLLGPNTGLGHNTAIFMIECQANFAISVIREMMKRDSHLVAVKKSAEDDFMNWIFQELKGTVWGSTNCGSWYANSEGKITTLWPESCTSYWRKTRKVNFSHFEFN